MARKTLIQHRRDTSVNWTSTNPILAEGEIGVETNTNKFKIGDGTTSWINLSYQGIETSALDNLTDVTITSSANGDILAYDSSSSQWKNVQPSAVSGIAFSGAYFGTTWTVAHNLGYRPAVTAVDNAITPNVVEGTVNHVDANNLTVTFNSYVTGNIYLS